MLQSEMNVTILVHSTNTEHDYVPSPALGTGGPAMSHVDKITALQGWTLLWVNRMPGGDDL